MFRTIKQKLLFVFALTSLLPLIGLSVYSYRYFNEQLSNLVFRQLNQAAA